MKRIPCDLFGKGEQLYFNITRLAEFEKALGQPIYAALTSGFSIGALLNGYEIGLRQYGRRSEQFYADKMQEMLDDGTCVLTDFLLPINKAIIGSGILGKKIYFQTFPEEATEEDKDEIKVEEELEKN